jgi:hypothetical protein
VLRAGHRAHRDRYGVSGSVAFGPTSRAVTVDIGSESVAERSACVPGGSAALTLSFRAGLVTTA